MPFGNREKYFRGSFQLQYCRNLKKYQPSGNLKLNNLGIFLGLKLRIFMGKILSISLELNFTPNTLGCYGLNQSFTPSKIGLVLSPLELNKLECLPKS